MANIAEDTNIKPASFLFRLPPEIWNECWGHCIDNENDLNALSLTCRPFQAICQPLLFRNQIYWAPFPEDIQKRKTWSPTTKRLIRSGKRILLLAQDDTLRAMVRHWEFHGSWELDYYPPPGARMKRLLKAFHAVEENFMLSIPLFTNLRGLRIHNIDVQASVFAAIGSLPHLKSLEFVECILDEDTPHHLPLRMFSSAAHPKNTEHEHSSPSHLVSPYTIEDLRVLCHEAAQVFLPPLLAASALPCLTK